jgi:hypothetical protein
MLEQPDSSSSKSKSIAAKPVPRTLKPAQKKPTPTTVAAITKIEKNSADKKERKASEKTKPNVKVIRDSFTMPQSDYSKIAELKMLCLKEGMHVKKSELLRAGILLLSQLNTAQLKKTIAQIAHIKTGRPKKN